jgi:hypothetical protein
VIKWGVRFAVVGIVLAAVFGSGDLVGALGSLAVLAYLLWRSGPFIGRDLSRLWAASGRLRAPRFSRGGADL